MTIRLTTVPALACLALMSAGCSIPASWRGEQTKRDIYLNLMTPDQAAEFKGMEADWQDDEQLVLYCQEVGVYQKWHGTLPERQGLIRRKRVAAGFLPDEVRMAWGPPEKVEDISSDADRQESRARSRWLYGGKADRAGAVHYGREAVFLNERLESFKAK